MILKNEFTVGFGIEAVWAHMIDLANMADCLPGATIEEFEPPNVYKGAIRVRIGPMTVDYKGQATLVDIDEQGSAVATLRSRLEATAEGTRVVTETDLQITGPQAQFGKGVLEDVGSRVLDEFSKRLEAKISAEARGETTAEEPVGDGVGDHPRTGGHHGADDEVLDLGRVVAQTMVLRVAKIAGGVVALAMALKLVRRRGPRS
jgi:carbon monoxide dehydrogenase subunit G